MPLILQGLLRTPDPAPAVLAAAALAGLLLPFRRPSARVEAAAGLAAAALTLLTGCVSWADARQQVTVVMPVVAFLVASLLVAECCAAAGVFTYLGTAAEGTRSGCWCSPSPLPRPSPPSSRWTPRS